MQCLRSRWNAIYPGYTVTYYEYVIPPYPTQSRGRMHIASTNTLPALPRYDASTSVTLVRSCPQDCTYSLEHNCFKKQTSYVSGMSQYRTASPFASPTYYSLKLPHSSDLNNNMLGNAPMIQIVNDLCQVPRCRSSRLFRFSVSF